MPVHRKAFAPMRASREQLLILRIFHESGDVFLPLSIEEAYEELKALSGKDFGKDEQRWRKWLEAHNEEIRTEFRSRWSADELDKYRKELGSGDTGEH